MRLGPVPSNRIRFALALLATSAGGAAAAAQTGPSEPCCNVVRIEIDPADPAGGIVTVRDRRTGQMASFRAADGASAFRLRQPVTVNSAAGTALAGGRSYRLLAAAASPQIGPLGATSSPASAPPGVTCTRLNVNGTAAPGAVLTVSVNGADVGSFDGGIYSDLEQFMNPGANVVRLTFAGAQGPASADLRCLRPGQSSSRTTILTLRPSASRLSAETRVNYQPR